MTTTNSDGVSSVPAARSVPIVTGDTPAMREWAEQLVARARAEGVELTGDDGLLTAMVRQVLQTAWRSSSRTILVMNRSTPSDADRGTRVTAARRRRSRPMLVMFRCGSRGIVT